MTTSRFPHLKDANAWPGLRTVDPFALQVSFDPYLWGPDVVIHLCKTRLDAEYQNVGGWETAAARDAWFDSRAEREFRLESEFHVLPGSEIKLPIAFEVLNHYNQLFIDFPPTSTEDGSNTSTRYYFFISDVQYRSPSSTACIITVDEWSTHMFDIDMEYIDLDRGHAPMAAVSASSFLSDPMRNSSYLTVPDEVFGDGDRLRYSARHVINAGPHWLVIAMTADPEQDPGTYGHRENWRVPTSSAYRVEGAISQAVFAIEPSDANLMINRINERAPQLLPTVQAVFLIPKRMVTTGTAFSFLDVQCHEISPQQTVTDLITLNQDMFGYPSEYRDIAKLYTMPYAWIELTDETGRIQRIAVEETTGTLKVSVLASILAPFIGVDAYIAGIGSYGESQLTWDNMTSHSFNIYGDWTRSLHRWNIPTYAVVQNSERAFEWLNHWQRVQANEANTTAYNTGIETNNLNYSLRNAVLDRQTARLLQQQENDSRQLQLSQVADNDILAILITKSNADLYMDKDLNDTLSSLQQQEFALAVSNANASAVYTNAENQTALNLSHSYADYVAMDGALATATATVDTVGNIATNVTSMNNLDNIALGRTDEQVIGTIQQGITDTIGIMSTVNSMNYNNTSANAGVTMAQLNLWGAKQNAKNIQATYSMAMSNNRTVAQMSNLVADVKTANAIQCETDKLARQQTLDTASLTMQQSYQTAISNGDISLARAQAGSVKGMSDTSLSRRKQVQDESLANAHRAGRLGSPRVFAQPTGSMTNYTRPQVLMANIKTQDPGAIAAAGDHFLRYGYALSGRQWRVTSLNVMEHFTFWKGEPRFGADSINEVTRGILSAMFREGTFVWRNPDDIGSISIYDN